MMTNCKQTKYARTPTTQPSTFVTQSSARSRPTHRLRNIFGTDLGGAWDEKLRKSSVGAFLSRWREWNGGGGGGGGGGCRCGLVVMVCAGLCANLLLLAFVLNEIEEVLRFSSLLAYFETVTHSNSISLRSVQHWFRSNAVRYFGTAAMTIAMAMAMAMARRFPQKAHHHFTFLPSNQEKCCKQVSEFIYVFMRCLLSRISQDRPHQPATQPSFLSSIVCSVSM
eukprot:gene4073-8453_t